MFSSSPHRKNNLKEQLESARNIQRWRALTPTGERDLREEKIQELFKLYGAKEFAKICLEKISINFQGSPINRKSTVLFELARFCAKEQFQSIIFELHNLTSDKKEEQSAKKLLDSIILERDSVSGYNLLFFVFRHQILTDDFLQLISTEMLNDAVLSAQDEYGFGHPRETCFEGIVKSTDKTAIQLVFDRMGETALCGAALTESPRGWTSFQTVIELQDFDTCTQLIRKLPPSYFTPALLEKIKKNISKNIKISNKPDKDALIKVMKDFYDFIHNVQENLPNNPNEGISFILNQLRLDQRNKSYDFGKWIFILERAIPFVKDSTLKDRLLAALGDLYLNFYALQDKNNVGVIDNFFKANRCFIQISNPKNLTLQQNKRVGQSLLDLSLGTLNQQKQKISPEMAVLIASGNSHYDLVIKGVGHLEQSLLPKDTKSDANAPLQDCKKDMKDVNLPDDKKIESLDTDEDQDSDVTTFFQMVKLGDMKGNVTPNQLREKMNELSKKQDTLFALGWQKLGGKIRETLGKVEPRSSEFLVALCRAKIDCEKEDAQSKKQQELMDYMLKLIDAELKNPKSIIGKNWLNETRVVVHEIFVNSVPKAIPLKVSMLPSPIYRASLFPPAAADNNKADVKNDAPTVQVNQSAPLPTQGK